MVLRSHLVIFFLTLLINPSFAQIIPTNEHNSNLPVEVTADSLEVQQKNNMAIFSGHVEALQGKFTLKAERMEVHYQEQADGKTAVSRINAREDVSLSSPTDTVQGEQGIFDVQAGTITLTGNVMVTSGKNIVKGDKLIYNLNSGKSTMVSTTKDGKKGRVKAIFTPKEEE